MHRHLSTFMDISRHFRTQFVYRMSIRRYDSVGPEGRFVAIFAGFAHVARPALGGDLFSICSISVAAQGAGEKNRAHRNKARTKARYSL